MKKFRIGVDFDGTLNYSLPRHVAVLRSALDECSVTLSQNCIDKYLDGKREGMSTQAYLRNCGAPKAQAVSAKWQQRIEDDEFLGLDALYEGILPLISRLSAIADLFLVTARRREQALLVQVRAMQLLPHLQDIFVVQPGEKAAERKWESTKHLGLTHIVGDTETDLAWTQFSKANFFPLCWGFRSDSWWKRHGFQSFAGLTDVVNQIL